MTIEILSKALHNQNKTIIDEIAKVTAFKYLGTNNVDLYISTRAEFAEKKIRANLLAIKDAVKEIDNKIVRDVYINNVKCEVELNELRSKHEIELIDLDSISDDKTNEMSGENNIVDQLFEYESSVLNKNKVLLHMYQKDMNKEWKEEINTSIVKSRFSLKKRNLTKTLNRLISLKYVPNNNDTKEVIELLKTR